MENGVNETNKWAKDRAASIARFGVSPEAEDMTVAALVLAVKGERDKIADWLDSLIEAGENKFGNDADNLFAQKALKLVSPIIRSGAYAAKPPPTPQ